MKTVLGYSPYQQAGMPKGPLLIATLALIVAFGLIGAVVTIGSSSSESSAVAGNSSSESQVADIAQMDYAMGHDAGLVAVYLYPASTPAAVICRNSYGTDFTNLRAIDSSLSISQPDYLAGCQAALEEKGW